MQKSIASSLSLKLVMYMYTWQHEAKRHEESSKRKLNTRERIIGRFHRAARVGAFAITARIAINEKGGGGGTYFLSLSESRVCTCASRTMGKKEKRWCGNRAVFLISDTAGVLRNDRDSVASNRDLVVVPRKGRKYFMETARNTEMLGGETRLLELSACNYGTKNYPPEYASVIPTNECFI